MGEKKIPCIFYLYLHAKLYEGLLTKETSIKDIKKSLFQWKIPKKIRPLIIKELEILGLIEINKRYYVKFRRPVFKEENYNEYYKKLGIF